MTEQRAFHLPTVSVLVWITLLESRLLRAAAIAVVTYVTEYYLINLLEGNEQAYFPLGKVQI